MFRFRLAKALDGRGAHNTALLIMGQISGTHDALLDDIRMHSLHASGDALALEHSNTVDLANYYSSKLVIKTCPGKGC